MLKPSFNSTLITSTPPPEVVLREAARLATSTFNNSEEVMEVALDVMSRFLETRTLFVARFNQHEGQEQTLTVLKVRNRDGCLLCPNATLPLPSVYSTSVFGSIRPVVINDIYQDSLAQILPLGLFQREIGQLYMQGLILAQRYKADLKQALAKGLGARSCLAVPLLYNDGSSYGILCGIDPSPLHLRDRPELLELLQILAHLLISQIEREELNFQIAKANQLRDHLMTAISHNLRTPLVSILSFSELMLNLDYNKFDVEKLKEWVMQIELNTSTMLDGVNDLLDYSPTSFNNLEGLDEKADNVCIA